MSISDGGKSVSPKRTVKLSEVTAGETVRIVRVGMLDTGCRRRFAEMGIYEGTKVTVTGAGETLMLAVGEGRLGVSKHCAALVTVLRLA